MLVRRSHLPLIATSIGLALASSKTASAHEPFEITTEARLHAERLDVNVLLAGRTAIRLCDVAKAHRSELRGAELEAQRPRFEACARALYVITAGGDAMQPLSTSVLVTEENDLEVKLVYPPPPKSPLRFDAVLLKRLSDPMYGAVLTVTGEATFLGQRLLRADESTLELDITRPVPSSAPSPVDEPGPGPPRLPIAEPPGVSSSARLPSFGQYLRLGVEHILGGYDHLLFLAALLVTYRRLRPVLGAVTCFTLAHSLTLALAALGLVSIPSRIVEPFIAATIVFVAVENLFRSEEPKHRWVLAFAFGLIHGFGFASVLRGIGLGAPGAPFVIPLFSFNLGVEIGQIAVGGVFLAILWKARTIPRFARHGPNAISFLIGALGVYWLLARTLFDGPIGATNYPA